MARIQEVVLGCSARDVIHGFRGVVTGYVRYITGCDQALVQPPMKEDGTVPDGRWIDVQRLEVLDAPLILLDNRATPGPDAPAPVK